MPEDTFTFHWPPGGGRRILGKKLVPGDVIQENDVYASSSGSWEKAPCLGLTLQPGSDTVWVRPIVIENLTKHLPEKDLASAVFRHFESEEQEKSIQDHLSSCELCSDLVRREQERNPLVGLTDEQLSEVMKFRRSLEGLTEEELTKLVEYYRSLLEDE